MTFEEEFPSLLGTYNIGTSMDEKSITIKKRYLQQACLDKQRVKEAILKLYPPKDVMYDSETWCQALKAVEKELGL